LALSALHGERGAVVALDVLLQRRRAFIGVDIENDLAFLRPNVSSDYLGHGWVLDPLRESLGVVTQILLSPEQTYIRLLEVNVNLICGISGSPSRSSGDDPEQTAEVEPTRPQGDVA
jgi:hypothetical protein